MEVVESTYNMIIFMLKSILKKQVIWVCPGPECQFGSKGQLRILAPGHHPRAQDLRVEHSSRIFARRPPVGVISAPDREAEMVSRSNAALPPPRPGA